MNCDLYKEYIMKYMDKVITEAEEIKLNKHLKQCNACSMEFNELKSIVNVLEEENVVEPPADFENAVVKKINELNIYRKKQSKKIITISCIAFVFTFAAILLMLAVLLRESILGLLLGVGVSEPLSYAVYGFLTRIDLLIVYAAYVVGNGKLAFSDFYYILVGLVVIGLISKTYEVKSVRVSQKSEVLLRSRKK
ncbi:MAG TPA: zf-HC2 domain-containing protein [Acetivibrio sp.]|uniref:zf-HC2 domain-containing protein n=1 Tax=Acetivibrio sp. TaxID=1872092 RepID=UPI002B815AAD|nr:zf-HC2 domain-containing protein [Acetivibrio sp.]HOM02756.1 zf-HC2 domain-containing protein [Acetivibrio sp.]